MDLLSKLKIGGPLTASECQRLGEWLIRSAERVRERGQALHCVPPMTDDWVSKGAVVGVEDVLKSCYIDVRPH